MASKFVSVFLLVTIVSQGYAQSLKEVEEEDANINFISHPLYSRVITIPKSLFDTLLTCRVTYPNGATYEVFPTNRLPDDEITSVPQSCSVAFGYSERIEQFSGTYQLQSLVQHQDQSMTLTNQRFHVTITGSEVGMPV